jgi:penicillin amidase
VHGPVIEWDDKAGVAYSLAMNYWMREMDATETMVGFNQARNIQEFAAWTSKVTTMHNWFCATRDGDIGFWFCGKIPRRSSAIDLRFPIPGTGEYDWQGDVPFSEMPQIINPRQGYLINWNTKPTVWWATGDASGWGAVNRLRSIRQALARHDLLTVAAMSDLQKDLCLNHWFADYFKQYLLDAAARKRAWADPRVREALRYLKAWDNHGSDRSVGMTIFQAWHRALLKAVFSDEFGDLLAGTSNSSLDRSGSLLYRTLKGSKAGLPPSRDYWNGADRDQVMVDVLKAVLADLEKTYGTPQMNRWMYDLGKISFDPLPGIPRYNRGTYIQIIECSKPDLVGVSILPPGQSEDPKSPHYGDQRELAGYWLFKEQVFDAARLMK